MSEMYVLGFIEKCAEIGVDPEEVLEAAKEPALKSRIYDYLAQLLPILGPGTVGAVRANSEDESPTIGALKGIGGNLAGATVGSIGGGLAGGSAGGALGYMVGLKKKRNYEKQISAVRRAMKAAKGKRISDLGYGLRKLIRAKRMALESPLLLGLAGLGSIGAATGSLFGGAEGLRYATSPEDNE